MALKSIAPIIIIIIVKILNVDILWYSGIDLAIVDLIVYRKPSETDVRKSDTIIGKNPFLFLNS